MRTLRLPVLVSALSLAWVAAPARAANTDYMGADLTINANVTMDGVQSNIRNLVIAQGVTVSVTPGLLLEFDAQNVDVRGTINADGAGLPGGAPGTDSALVGGGGNGGFGPGGGAKGVDGASGSGSGGAGGGGGAYGGAGGKGGNGYSTCNGDQPVGGAGGAAYGNASTHTIEMGSGGGGGGGLYSNGSCTAPNVIANRSGAPGGRGGGAVTLIAQQNLSVTGTITANGQAGGFGGTAGCGGAGSGGGGSGGGILLDGALVTLTGTLSANGGPGGGQTCAGVGCGGPTTTTCNPVSTAQAGGGGRIKIFGVSIPTNTATSTVGGANPGTLNIVLTGPIASLVPASTSFGNQRVATTSMPATVTVMNSGLGTLVVSAVTLGGANPGDFSVMTPPLPFSVPAMSSATFTVRFTPSAIGPRAATVTLATNDKANPMLVENLDGVGVKPIAQVMPNVLHFGSQLLATTSAPQAITVANAGTDTLTVTKIALGGANPADFALGGVPVLPVAVAPGKSFTFNVTFTPQALGMRASEVDVTDDDGVQVVPVDGVGVAPKMVVSPLSAFGPQRVGTTTSVMVSIANQGTAPLTVNGITLGGAAAGDYALSMVPMLPATVGPGMTVSFTISFLPSALGPRSASVKVTGSDAQNPTATVSLNGVGVLPLATVAPRKLSFGNQRVATTSLAQTVTITNGGTDDLHVSNITLSGPNAADFALAKLPPFPATLPPGASAKFDVTFTPTAVGARSAQAIVISDDPNNPSLPVDLAGNGISPFVSLSTMSIDFGKVPIGTKPTRDLVVTNTGNDTLTIQMASLSGSPNFTLAKAPPLPVTLNPNDQATFSIAYAPNAVAKDAGKITLVTDNPNMPNFEVPLTGEGITGVLSVAPLSLDFGGVVIGQTSAPKDVTLTNTGSASFQVTGLTIMGPDAMAFVLPNQPAVPAPLQPGDTLVVHVAYAPTAHAAQSATLHIGTDLPNGMTADVQLAGMGLEAGIGVSPAMIDFGTVVVGASGGPVTVTVRNTGDAPLALGAPTIGGGGATAYKVDFTPPGALMPGDTATMTVTFTPPSAGTFEATLHVVSTDAAVAPAEVKLTGIGVDAKLDVSPLVLDFKTVAIGAVGGPQTVTVRNPGAGAVALTAIDSSAVDFVIGGGPTLPYTLKGGEAQTFQVSFRPSAPGPQTARIVIGTMYRKEAAVVMALGTGVATVRGGGCACGLGGGGGDKGPSAAVLALLVLTVWMRKRRAPR